MGANHFRPQMSYSLHHLTLRNLVVDPWSISCGWFQAAPPEFEMLGSKGSLLVQLMFLDYTTWYACLTLSHSSLRNRSKCLTKADPITSYKQSLPFMAVISDVVTTQNRANKIERNGLRERARALQTHPQW